MTILPDFKEVWSEDDFGRAAMFFPLAGLLVGGLSGIIFFLTAKIFPRSAAAALTLIAWVALTGGLHWDGVADCLDGFSYAGTPEKRFSIMKDPHHGTFATIGVCCALILKAALISSVDPGKAIPLFALISALARWGVLLTLHFPLANPNGMAAALTKNCPVWTPVPALVFPLLPVLFLNFSVLLLFIPTVLVPFGIVLIARNKIGGINGDVMGLTIEMIEIVLLLFGVLL